MQEENELNSDQRDLENALRSLSPARTQLNPIAAAFDAGKMVHRRQMRVLSAISVTSILIAISSVVWTQRPPTSSPQASIAVVHESKSESKSTAQIVSSSSGPTLITLEQTLQSHGIDGLPQTTVPKVSLNNPL